MLHAPPPPWNTEARYSKHVTVAYTSLALVPCLPPPSPWQDAREAASQAKIEALMRDLEQSRAEAAEMQARLLRDCWPTPAPLPEPEPEPEPEPDP